jgi:histidinol dehydrogenase
MKIVNNPSPSEWAELIQRPTFDTSALNETVADILQTVKTQGDEALFNFNRKFDGVEINDLYVTPEELKNPDLPNGLKEAIQLAYRNIEKFHNAQKQTVEKIETSKGVFCWRKAVPINAVGLYIPGGSAPLFSTLLMLGIPAKLAGCKEIVICTPPQKDGFINPSILFVANLIGSTKIFKVGGAQAIAAMTYGTESVPKVDKIFGPGNQYVTKAKQMVQMEGLSIDMPAGPSEVLVIADETSDPEFVAADLLSQAEHGPDSQVILLSDSLSVIQKTEQALVEQIKNLPRKDIAQKALDNGCAVLLRDLEECITFSNAYAPEHLILAIKEWEPIANKVQNAGSVFLGNYSCESAGDYASGTNHTLPTNGFAKAYSGVSLSSFQKQITFQELNQEGIENIGPAIELMAEAEGLQAHKYAVSIRLSKIGKDD